MRNLLFALITLLSFTALEAQKIAPEEKNDPQAKKVLDKIRKKYEGYKTVEANFNLNIEVPQQPVDVQKGTIGQEGSKFKLDMDEQTIASDGKTTWVHLKKNKEIQINDTDPANSDNGFLTPKDLLNRYQKGDYLYAVTEITTEKGVPITQIEFKPKDKKSEYSKIRVSINEKAGTINGIKAFSKDGSRYTFTITKLSPNKAFPAGYFQLDPKQYPGVKVEDLRM